MPAPRKYPNELRERALRLVTEAMAEDPSLSLNGAVLRIGPRVGVVPDTLRGWAKQVRVDAGVSPGTTTSDAARLKELEREVKELRRANELRERALRLVSEAMSEDPNLSLNGAVLRIGPRVGVVPDTLRGWAKQARVDAGVTPGTTTSDAARLKELEREVKELRRANEILLAASSFFARELDPRLPW